MKQLRERRHSRYGEVRRQALKKEKFTYLVLNVDVCVLSQQRSTRSQHTIP